MQCRNIVVVGASAGGIEALQQIVRDLPADLPASLFVTVHFPENGTSVLPRILSRLGSLPALHAADGQPIEPGHIYVAPPDRHLLVADHKIRLSRGPRENGHRPAVDPMFRSAATNFGPRVIGVLLSGNLDDGTSGLAAVKRHGGVALVQDPHEAMFGSMPQSAIDHVRVDRVAPARELAQLIVECVRDPAPDAPTRPALDDVRETEYSEVDLAVIETPEEHPGEVSAYSCPDCGGVLWRIQEGDFVRFRCRVGHGWTADALMAEQADQIDDALWAALRALEERASLLRSMAERYRRSATHTLASRFDTQADEVEARARLVRELLVRGREAELETHEERKSG
jgi:two-component system chemotaxis response regulator CheB